MTRFEDPRGDDNPTEDAVLRAENEREDAHRAKVIWAPSPGFRCAAGELLRILMASPPPSYAEVAAALDLPHRQHRADPGPVPAAAARGTGGMYLGRVPGAHRQ